MGNLFLDDSLDLLVLDMKELSESSMVDTMVKIESWSTTNTTKIVYGRHCGEDKKVGSRPILPLCIK